MAIDGIKSHYVENGTKYRALTEAQCETIINTAFEILEDVGMDIEEPSSRELLAQHGCTVNGNNVRVPRKVVIDAINSAPGHINLYDRNGNHKMDIGGTNIYFGSGPTNPFVNDFETGQRRSAVVQDTVNAAKVMDALPNIDFVMNLADPSDCPVEINDLYTLRAMLQNTTKPLVILARNLQTMEEQFEIITSVAGGWDAYRAKPFVASLCGDPITPLGMDTDAIEKLMYCAQNSIPVTCPSGVQLGTTGPVTIAGGLALGLAENFLCLVVTQSVNPGAPYMGCFAVCAVDMKTTVMCYGSPEHCLSESASADIYRYLNIPCFGTAGASETKTVDEQLAIESTFFIYNNVLNGGQMTHDLGFMDSALTTHLDALTMEDEIISYARRIKEGFEIDEETLALDVIKEVGPKGEFLTHEHTAENFRQVWYPTLLDRRIYPQWKEESKDMRTRVHDKTTKILAEHNAEPLPADVNAKIDAVIEKANKRVGAAK